MKDAGKITGNRHSWKSPSLGREVTLLSYGTEGVPILAFPGDSGSSDYWEKQGLIDALSFQIENGHNQLFCVDSIDQESFFNAAAEPRARINKHRQYEGFIIDEVLPHIRKKTGDLFLMTTGIHMGGYHALNLMLKYPGQIQKVIAIGGRFQIRPFLGDYFDDNVYFNNPLEYLPNLEEESLLEEIRNADIRLIVTPDDPYLELNYMLSDILRSKSIDHIFDYWIEAGLGRREVWGNILQRHVP
ncbi:alpha/beta hydrolase-fold protein [Balneolales bacterium ANBcel1]|nr:alpha/beta hydrolase-fold protein [Balneolales bacterium ANBcel1]